MPHPSLITQQPVTPVKRQRAVEMRHEMTPVERKLWAHLRAGHLEGYHFRRQQVIEPYIVDFYCHRTALVIEVDGSVHQEQQEYDQQRDQDLQALGLKVVRFSNTEVNQNLEGVLTEILRLCRSRGDEESLLDPPLTSLRKRETHGIDGN
jgi:very-short-patch-repair endonuclease